MNFYYYIIFIAILFFSSCKKDACATAICQHGAKCNEGICICLSGYEGSNCSTEIRQKFYGTYTGNTINLQNGETHTEEVILQEYPGKISRIKWVNKNLYIEVNQSNKIYIPFQSSSQGPSYSIKSTEPGTLNGDVLSLYWEQSSPGGTILYSFNGTR